MCRLSGRSSRVRTITSFEVPRYDTHTQTPFAMDPPTYEESASAYEYQQVGDSKGDSKVPHKFSIREEVGLSRTQHVAALVSKLLPQVRERARQGLSKSTLLLIPSNQGISTTLINMICQANICRCQPQRATGRLSVRGDTYTHPTRRRPGHARVLDAATGHRRAKNATAHRTV